MKSVESIPPLTMVDPKGKAPKTPLRNQKKRKLTKASKEEPNKTKLLASAMSATKTLEVGYLLCLVVLNVPLFKVYLALYSFFCYRQLPKVHRSSPLNLWTSFSP